MSDVAPERFIDTVFADQKTASVKAVIELDLFSAIGDDRVSLAKRSAGGHAAVRPIPYDG